MAEFGPRSLEKVVAIVGERDGQTREELHQILSRAGVKKISIQNSLTGLIALIGELSPDLIVVGDDLDPKVFEFIRDVRHNKLGNNPFVLVTTLVASERTEAVTRALQAGTDDVIIKPAKEDQLLQRLRRVTMSRQAFVVTSDYLGPDRRGKGRLSNIRRISVLNTMLEKASGQEMDAETLRGAVENSMTEVLHGRLDSNGYRLGFVCDLIIGAYESRNITPEVKERLLVLADVLKDAAHTARRLKESELAILCGSLTKQVTAIADHYQSLTDADTALLRKINTVVTAALRPRTSTEQLRQEADEGARTYQQRAREGFFPSTDILRGADESALDAFDEPIIEILPLPKGQHLFRQGDLATAAYIVTSGVIALYKESVGQRLPIAKVRKGEFFGEMAIIDGTERRASAFAMEDSTVSLVAKDTIERKMADSDPLVRSVLQMLVNSLRLVHDVYTPRSRHVSDSAREMREQIAAIVSYMDSSTVPAGLKAEGGDVADKLKTLTGDLVSLIERHPELDPRTPALPVERELPGRS